MNKQYLDIYQQNLVATVNTDFVEKLLPSLPYQNMYFLVCVVEAIQRLMDKKASFYSEAEALKAIVSQAVAFYQNINLSESFETYS